MFDSLELVDENNYKLNFEAKDQDVLSLIVKAQGFVLDQDNNFVTNHFRVTFNSDSLHLKVFKPNPSPEEIEQINKLCIDLKQPSMTNMVEYIIAQNQPLTNESFFSILKENHLSYDYLKDHLSSLTNLGLDFDIQLVEKLAKFEQNFIAIDCQDYIKFIPFDQFNKEKQVTQLINELLEQTDKPQVEEWLTTLYRRHLLNKPYDSNEIHHILDWMNQLTDFTILKQSLNYDRALAKANQWVVVENQKMGITTLVDEVGKDILPVSSYQDYTLVKLISKNARKREGYKMTNCIGRVHIDSDSIHSVRKNGRRVASLNIIDLSIREAKGPHNKGIKDDSDKLGTIGCLKAMGIDFSQNHHSDLHNIGIKHITFDFNGEDRITFDINFLDPLYASPDSTIKVDSAFSGVDFSAKDKFREEMILKIPESIRSKASHFILKAESLYQVCPLTNKMVHQDHYYSKKYLTPISLILEKYPKYKQIWLEATLTFMEKSRNRFNLVEDIGKGLGLVMDNWETLFVDEDSEEMRAFFKECVGLYDQYKLHPLFYKKIIYSNNLFYYLEDYTLLNDFNSMIKELAPLATRSSQRLDHVEINYDFTPFKPKITRETCACCKNQSIYEEQIEKIEKYNSLADDAEKAINDANEAWKVIESFYDNAMDTYTKLNTIILTQSKINIVKSKIDKMQLSDFKNIKEDLLSILDDVESFVNKKELGNVEEAISTVNSQIENLEGYRTEMDSLSYDVRKLEKQQEDCTGCSRCDGTDDECSECGGKPNPCDFSEISHNSSISFDDDMFLKSVKTFAEPYSYSNKHLLDLNVLVNAYSNLESIAKKPEEFIRSVFNFYTDHSK